ncbi:MAG: hypothetical protein ACRC1O_10970, partial [Ralstonia mannitolilytica]
MKSTLMVAPFPHIVRRPAGMPRPAVNANEVTPPPALPERIISTLHIRHRSFAASGNADTLCA